jgi:hypothetical protein
MFHIEENFYEIIVIADESASQIYVEYLVILWQLVNQMIDQCGFP